MRTRTSHRPGHYLIQQLLNGSGLQILAIGHLLRSLRGVVHLLCMIEGGAGPLPAATGPGWYVTAGCRFQTMWNGVTGRLPTNGIKDYDVFCFESGGLSWEAEDAVIKAGQEVFADLPAEVEIRNEAGSISGTVGRARPRWTPVAASLGRSPTPRSPNAPMTAPPRSTATGRSSISFPATV
ncbi:nucleotidyltransferase family protein [Streptomyces sp. NPDC059378]|uniref:nucleotidyltransferase family protein n=1 Tax=Streptomyces sp. NPDC059378 TaxID=3346815 RepID=UPI0036B21650